MQVLQVRCQRRVRSSASVRPRRCTLHRPGTLVRLLSSVHTCTTARRAFPISTSHFSTRFCFRFSEQIVGPLLKEHRNSPAWLCWLKHAQYLSILVQHVITRADLDSLRVLIGEHQELFAEVSL